MPSITTWTRLEPRARGADLLPALEARIHDPAWLLGRQWQLAEFRGQDAAFPIQMSYEVTSQPLAGYQPGGTADPFPLEASAAPEPASPMTAGMAATAGTELLELLTEHGCSASGRQAILNAFPLTLDPAAPVDAQGASYLGLLVDRVPDGRTLQPVLEQAVNSGAGLPASLGLSAADTAAVMAAATAWLAWLERSGPLEPARWIRVAERDTRLRVCDQRTGVRRDAGGRAVRTGLAGRDAGLVRLRRPGSHGGAAGNRIDGRHYADRDGRPPSAYLSRRSRATLLGVRRRQRQPRRRSTGAQRPRPDARLRVREHVRQRLVPATP